jgi:hypothetical protein
LIKSETEGAKNKGRKAHGANMYLTLIIIYFHMIGVANKRERQ